MFCARCGGAVAPADKDCTSCGASLRSLGSVRMTSVSEPVPELDEIFPEMATPEPGEQPSAVPARRPRPSGAVRVTTRGWVVLGAVVVLLVLLLSLLVR